MLFLVFLSRYIHLTFFLRQLRSFSHYIPRFLFCFSSDKLFSGYQVQKLQSPDHIPDAFDCLLLVVLFLMFFIFSCNFFIFFSLFQVAQGISSTFLNKIASLFCSVLLCSLLPMFYKHKTIFAVIQIINQPNYTYQYSYLTYC